MAITPVADQTTAFVNQRFPTTGILGTNLYDADPEPRVRPGTKISAITGNGEAVYAKAHAAVAAAGAVAIAASGLVTAAGAGYKSVVAVPLGNFAWFIKD